MSIPTLPPRTRPNAASVPAVETHAPSEHEKFLPSQALQAAVRPAVSRPAWAPEPPPPVPTFDLAEMPQHDERLAAAAARRDKRLNKHRNQRAAVTAIPRYGFFVGIAASWASLPTTAVVERMSDDETHAREVGAAVAAVGGALAVLALLWWLVAAAINAKRHSPLSVSPLLAPAVLVAAPAALVMAPAIQTDWAVFAALAALLAVVVGYFVLIGSYRGTAQRLGAPTRPWSALLWMPVFSMGVYSAAALLIIAGIADDSYTEVGLAFGILVVGAIVIAVATVVSWWQAMSSFDRACRRSPKITRAEELPSFMRGKDSVKPA